MNSLPGQYKEMEPVVRSTDANFSWRVAGPALKEVDKAYTSPDDCNSHDLDVEVFNLINGCVLSKDLLCRIFEVCRRNSVKVVLASIKYEKDR